jgi:iron complex outermembrane recepter protein
MLAVALAYALGIGGGATLIVGTAYGQDQQGQPRGTVKVEVTGSNIPRIQGETALPVQIITRDDIQKTGAVTTEDLLRTVAIAVQGNTNTVAASSAGSTASGVSSASLRGLGSQRTLVLINGRRIPGGGVITDAVSVDVNMIPLSAIERVEVLKDGASAIYGSDAIAGVINFILRHDYKGVEASATYGDSEHGGARQKIAVGTVGWGDLATDRWNVMVTAKYEKDEALFGRQRGFAKSGINVDANNDTTSGNTFPANFKAVDGSFGTVNPGAPNNCAPSVLAPFFPPTRCLRFGKFCRQSRPHRLRRAGLRPQANEHRDPAGADLRPVRATPQSPAVQRSSLQRVRHNHPQAEQPLLSDGLCPGDHGRTDA